MDKNGVESQRIGNDNVDVKTANYEDAITRLNTLQSSAEALARAKSNRSNEQTKENIQKVETFLERAGVEVDQLDDLSIIHVSGTKGKGSVCAMCESILRASGFKTGFFSSPHLVEVRERIRIDGKPIAYDSFAEYFNTVYDRLDANKDEYGGEMPTYFRFLTVMAFYTFLQEKVDVAVIEVGVGGGYDSTNIMRKPTVVGITTLDLDHTTVLGNTIERIAWHKASISKPGRPALTVPQPEEEALRVVMETALECGASSIECSPDIGSYDLNGVPLRLGLTGKHQFTNASLALQLCKTWIENHREKHRADGHRDLGETFQLTRAPITTATVATDVGMAFARPFVVPASFVKGLRECYWPGRSQIVRQGPVSYYLDCAHTPHSLAVCRRWFLAASAEESSALGRPARRLLLFNFKGDRDERTLLKPLIGCHFDGAAFCPNITGISEKGNSADLTACFTTGDRQLARCQRNRAAYEDLVKAEARTRDSGNQSDEVVTVETAAAGDASAGRAETAEQCAPNGTRPAGVAPATTAVLPTIADALRWAAGWADPRRTPAGALERSGHLGPRAHVQVLITGTVHLVGGVIQVLDPELVHRPAS